MSTAAYAMEPAGADEALARAHADELRALAARHGITELRFASRGRLVGRVEEDRDLYDVAGFDADASDLLGAPVSLFSDRVLAKPNVSADLVAAHAL